MSFDPGGGHMEFGFVTDQASVAAVEQAISDVAVATDRLAASQQRLAQIISSSNGAWSTAGQGVQQYSQQTTQASTTQQQFGQSLTTTGSGLQQYTQQIGQATTQQEQFAESQQQSISILQGAGTDIRSQTQDYSQWTGALANAGKEAQNFSKGLDETNTLQNNLAGTTQTSFEKIQQLGQGFGLAAGSITGLIFSTYSLQRAQFQVHRIETQLEVSRNKLEDMTRKLAKATEKYGADSEEVAAIQADMALAQQKVTNLQERAGLVQENYDRQLLTFATTTGPLVISTVSSMSQGITSMGEVLKISRTQVLGFISSWGGLIGVGSIIAVFAVGVVDAMMKIQKANDDMAKAIKESDWDKALIAKMEGLKTKTENPFAIITESLSTLAGTRGNVSGLDLLNLNNAQKQIGQQIIDFRQKIDDEMKSPDWIEALKFPSNISSGLDADAKVILDKLKGMAKNLVLGLKLDPTYVANFFKEIEQLGKDLKTKVENITAQFETAKATGGARDIAKFIFPSGPEVQANLTEFKNNLDIAHIAFVKFRAEQAAGYKGSVEDFITIYGGYLNDAQKDLLKNFVKNSDAMVAAQEKAQSDFINAFVAGQADYQARIKENAAKNAQLIKQAQEEFERNQLLPTNFDPASLQALIKGRDVLMSELFNFKGAPSHTAEVKTGIEQTIQNGVNEAKVDQATKPLVEKMRQGIADSINAPQVTTEISAAINQVLAISGENVQLDNILKGLKDTKFAQKLKDDWVKSGFDDAVKKTEIELQKFLGIIATATNVKFDPKLVDPRQAEKLAAISEKQNNLWKDQELELAALAQEHGALSGEVAQLTLNFEDNVAQLALLIARSIDVTRAWHDMTLQDKLLNTGFAEGAAKAQEFSDGLVKQAASNQTYRQGLEELANELGIVLPAKIDFTTEELQKIIEAFALTEQGARTLADIVDSKLAESLKTLDSTIHAESWKDFQKAFKEVDFGTLSKDAKNAFKEMENDMRKTADQGEVIINIIDRLIVGINNGKLKDSTLRQGLEAINDAIDKAAKTDPEAKFLKPYEDFIDSLSKGERAQVIRDHGDAIKYLGERLSSGDLTPEDVLAFIEDFGVGIAAAGQSVEEATKSFQEHIDVLNKAKDFAEQHGKKLLTFESGLVSLSTKKGKPTKTTSEIDKTLQGVLGLVPGEDKQKPDQTKQDLDQLISGLNKDVPAAAQKAQTALANLSNEGSKSLSALAKVSSTSISGLRANFSVGAVASQRLQTAFANLSDQGSNSMALLIKNLRPHVITLTTYFAKTIPDAVAVAAKSILALSVVISGFISGKKGGGGGPKLTNIFGAGPGMSGGPVGDLQGKDIIGSLGDGQLNLGGGGGALGGGPFDKFTQKEQSFSTGGSKGGAGGITQILAAFQVIIIGAQKAQTAIANLADQGANSLSILVKAARTHVVTLNTYFNKTIPIALQNAQESIANFANEGSNSLSILIKAAKAHVTTLNTYFNKTVPVALQHSQEGFANLANEGANSLSLLAKASSKQIKGMDNNLKEGEKAAQKLQTGLANLSNEGSKSLNALAHASSTAMNGFVNNLKKGESEVKNLISAINKIPKNVTVHYSSTGSTAEKKATGGLMHFGSGGILSADSGRILSAVGEQLVIVGDNPGGHETVAFIPHNNPSPTLKKLARIFGNAGRGSNVESGGGSSDARESGDYQVINLHIDGEKMMTWIRRKIGRDRQGR